MTRYQYYELNKDGTVEKCGKPTLLPSGMIQGCTSLWRHKTPGGAEVSTIFLCCNFIFDKPRDPTLFETRVFDREKDYHECYASSRDAAIGHAEALRMIGEKQLAKKHMEDVREFLVNYEKISKNHKITPWGERIT